MVNAEIKRAKTSLRMATRKRRASRSEADRAVAAASLAQRVLALLPTHAIDITCYASLPSEPGTSELVLQLLGRGHRVWLPRVEGRRLAWVRIRPDTVFRPGALGISEPEGAGVDLPEHVSVLLMPAAAVDESGRRLGQGGGYYDRVVARLPQHADGGPLRVALVYDDEVVTEVAAEAHDGTVDVVVTPRRTLLISA